MKDPIVIDPPGFDQKAAWGECHEYSDRMHAAGRDIAAAHGADPGICSCPCCGEMYWAWGARQRCVDCGFEYDTSWWAMYSWGAQAARRGEKVENFSDYQKRYWDNSKYFRWAFENKAEPSMEAARAVDWKTVFPEDARMCK